MKNKDLKLLLYLIIWNLIPSIYFTIRANIISVSGVDIDILGQMEWFDVINEILVTVLTIPIYYFLKKDNTNGYQNFKVGSTLFGIYFIFATLVALNIEPLTRFMNVSGNINVINKYLFLQTFSLLLNFIIILMIIFFTLNKKFKAFEALIVIKFISLAFFDFLLIPQFLEYGAAYSEIIVNFTIAIASIILGFKLKTLSLKKEEITFRYKDFLRVGSFAGFQIFLDNFIYIVIIMKMVNSVSETGNFWMANNFIYGWLLVPAFALGEVIKASSFKKITFKNSWHYAIYIVIIWFITMPFWKFFIEKGLASNPMVLLPIISPQIVFYVFFIVCVVLDSYFISNGQTIYLAIISLIVNVVYYGIAFILFRNGFFTMNIKFIIYLFGFGMLTHMVFSILFYILERKINQVETSKEI